MGLRYNLGGKPPLSAAQQGRLLGLDSDPVELLLVVLDGLEELREVALPEAAAAGGLLQPRAVLRARLHAPHPLNDFYENGRPVAQRLGEDLEEDTLVIPVDQDAQLFALRKLLRAERVPPHPVRQPLVILVPGPRHEVEAPTIRPLPHPPQGVKDVVRFERDVLHAGALVLLEVRLDLGLAAGAVGGLVDGQQHGLVVAGEHHAVEARVHGAHVLRHELRELVEARHGGHVVHHLQQVKHVPHHVVDALQPEHLVRARLGRVVGEEGAVETVPRDEAKHDLAVQMHLGQHHGPAALGVLREHLGLGHSLGPVSRGNLVRLGGVVHQNPYRSYGEAVAPDEPTGLFLIVLWERRYARFLHLGRVRRSESEGNAVRSHNVTGERMVAGALIGLRDQLHTEPVSEATICVARIGAPEVQVVEAVDCEPIRHRVVPFEIG
eukprot:CAMPEP_0118927552 /NCGR_PEP_ID=MMETSP1169-20130426/4995_1 /TAXON_ID=36882 /ORGANISM="Pyramimonas obovata, Strain CCMP722" /LENGTH=436 /DNA_ID=CAMNT_0006869329 /DNA_START=243 /DNA_END=1549 /DNA_ORIENTATION=+